MEHGYAVYVLAAKTILVFFGAFSGIITWVSASKERTAVRTGIVVAVLFLVLSFGIATYELHTLRAKQDLRFVHRQFGRACMSRVLDSLLIGVERAEFDSKSDFFPNYPSCKDVCDRLAMYVHDFRGNIAAAQLMLRAYIAPTVFEECDEIASRIDDNVISLLRRAQPTDKPLSEESCDEIRSALCVARQELWNLKNSVNTEDTDGEKGNVSDGAGSRKIQFVIASR